MERTYQERRRVIKSLEFDNTTPITGICYYYPANGAVLEGRDGKVNIPLEGIPVPIQEDDFRNLNGDFPSYDVVGRGIYCALRNNPDCVYGGEYAQLLKDAYPHLLSELATHVVMLDKKDVDVPYLDRKINYLKIFGLIEPQNPNIPLEIGMAYLDKGMHLSALQLTTVSLFRAEKYLAKAVELAPANVKAVYHLGEVSYILGKYETAGRLWQSLIKHDLDKEQALSLTRRLQRVEQGIVSFVPAVDYLEVVAMAFGHYQAGEYEESAALLLDVLDDAVFSEEFPIPEIHFILGLCYQHMAMPKCAEEYLREAISLNPEYAEAHQALTDLYS